jgi:hypothetical protein
MSGVSARYLHKTPRFPRAMLTLAYGCGLRAHAPLDVDIAEEPGYLKLMGYKRANDAVFRDPPEAITKRTT